MIYENITRAVFRKRLNRFAAEVDTDGHTETVHVKNTGRLKELLVSGAEVWLTAPGTTGRKTEYDLVAVRKENGMLFNIDSQAANAVVKEWLAGQDYSAVIPEYTYGDSRIDFYMEKDAGKEEPGRFLLEVKGCTLEKDGIGYFPDAPTQRGVKHIRELMKAVKEGYGAVLAFVMQADGIREVRPNSATHPEFASAMEEAEKAGVKIWFFACHVRPDGLLIKAKYEK